MEHHIDKKNNYFINRLIFFLTEIIKAILLKIILNFTLEKKLNCNVRSYVVTGHIQFSILLNILRNELVVIFSFLKIQT